MKSIGSSRVHSPEYPVTLTCSYTHRHLLEFQLVFVKPFFSIPSVRRTPCFTPRAAWRTVFPPQPGNLSGDTEQDPACQTWTRPLSLDPSASDELQTSRKIAQLFLQFRIVTSCSEYFHDLYTFYSIRVARSDSLTSTCFMLWGWHSSRAKTTT